MNMSHKKLIGLVIAILLLAAGFIFGRESSLFLSSTADSNQQQRTRTNDAKSIPTKQVATSSLIRLIKPSEDNGKTFYMSVGDQFAFRAIFSDPKVSDTSIVKVVGKLPADSYGIAPWIFECAHVGTVTLEDNENLNCSYADGVCPMHIPSFSKVTIVVQ